MKHHDYTYIKTVCPECKNDKILRDNHRQETYCTLCGIILQENTLIRITDTIKEANKKETEVRTLWRKRIHIHKKKGKHR
jgi:transcription initiation factor TFIIIB Brf1 subunit/transcription initiation factor TFIIB